MGLNVAPTVKPKGNVRAYIMLSAKSLAVKFPVNWSVSSVPRKCAVIDVVHTKHHVVIFAKGTTVRHRTEIDVS